METSLYSTTIPPMIKMMRNLIAVLDKAASHADTKGTERRPGHVHMEALLSDRLVFDQFNLLQQLQRVSDNAKGGAARLAGIEAPKMDDTERTLADIKARLEKTVEFIESVKPEDIMGQEGRRITLPYWPGKELTAAGYATEYLMPNFYFHAVTAYAIIRKNGIDVGKSDYIGELPFVN